MNTLEREISTPSSQPLVLHSKVLPTELEQYHPFWQRSETLPNWAITIVPG